MTIRIDKAPILLNKDGFMRQLLGHMAETLEEVIGLPDAEGFISLIGQTVGEDMNAKYTNAMQVSKLSRDQIAEVLIDFKKRISGDFYLISESEERIVVGNHACPFGDSVLDRPALCMMTSSVFGTITAENLGYAKVSIDQAIARGDAKCRVTINLKPESAARGLEYFATS